MGTSVQTKAHKSSRRRDENLADTVANEFRCSAAMDRSADWVPDDVASVLVISPFEEDRVSLQRILSQTDWSVHYAYTFQEGLKWVCGNFTAVVICDQHVPACDLREALDRIGLAVVPPTLIVVHSLGDDSLWAVWTQALNLGAHDLLLKPFDGNEVLAAVRSAMRAFEMGGLGGHDAST